MDFRINPVQPPSPNEKKALRLMIFGGLISMGLLLHVLFQNKAVSYFPLYILLVITMIYYSLKYLHEWYHYFSISSDRKPARQRDYTVDILTTYCAGEPFDMLEQTLTAIQNITYPHTAWCCDEADDRRVKQLCCRLGVKHVTRIVKKDAKAGNINNALQFATGELCVVLDPDHIPAPCFLDGVVDYFDDPSVGFVQIVQAYYNQEESLVAKGAAQQTYPFYGPMMMSMHKYGTVQAIGANCTFRRSALDSIGGHASGLAEDMHTAMKLHAAGWRSFYVPAILTRGLVPATMSSYYKQQLKWSRGVWELFFITYPKLFSKFSWRQKVHYFTLPFHYLSGLIFFINFLIPVISLFTGYIPLQMDVLTFFLAALPLFSMSLLIRHYAQKWLPDEKERGFHIVGGILQIGAWWVHTVGIIYTLLRKKVPYIPTPKNDNEPLPLLLNVPNILVAAISLAAIIYGLLEDFNPYTIFMAGLASLQIAFMVFNLSISGYINKKSRVGSFVMKLRQYTWLIKKTHGFLRRYSLALSVLVIAFFGFAYWKNQQLPQFLPKPLKGLQVFYRGLNHHETTNNGSEKLNFAIADKSRDIAIVSSEIAWNVDENNRLDTNYLQQVYRRHAIPLIVWNPWQRGTSGLTTDNENIQDILKGKYDELFLSFAKQIAVLNKPVFLRFINENTADKRSLFAYSGCKPGDFKAAWQYVHLKFDEAGANKVIWIWNPPDAAKANDYFPGDNFVDWLGVNILDTNWQTSKKNQNSFDSLYRPYHSLQLFKSGFPVMLTETAGSAANRVEWWNKTWQTLDTAFKEIKSILVNPGDYTMLANSPGANMPINVDEIIWQKTYTHPELQNLPFPVKSIVYDKGYNWFRNRHTLGLKIMEEDLQAIKKIGANTVERIMPGIYDRDFKKAVISNKMNLIVRFSFLVTPQVIDDNKKMEQQKEKILGVIRNNLDKKYIIAWNLGDDVLHDLASQTYKPDYFYYEQKYIAWLEDLCREIRKVDAIRPIVMDLDWDINGRKQFNNYKSHIPQINTYMLSVNVKDSALLKEPLEHGMTWGKVDVQLWPLIPGIQQSGTVPQWQDIETTDYVKLKGLLDLEGRKKQGYRDVLNFWGNKQTSSSPVPEIRILKPAELAAANDKLLYHIVYKDKNSDLWKLINDDKKDIRFEWYLVRQDRYGNTMFMNKVGDQPYIELKIPSNPQYYRLYVEAVSGEEVRMANTTLNTPLE
jgi:cellulose synthase/poly-beta-1,6-N-acetylglucosamine synthase-like glycosyltransferase